MSDFMNRHGFERQMTAAMVVKRANEHLPDILGDIAEDVRAISLVEGVLKIAVCNASAGFTISQIGDELRNRLLRDFPSAEILSIIHKLDPKSVENRLQ